jgi:hypothetical protein
MLLKSKEKIDMLKKDADGRLPIELCFSVSTIFKTLRRAMNK